MAANEQVIDQVISPVVDKQVLDLTKLLSDLNIQMIADLKTANSLNDVLANSKSFAEYNKNATQTALQLEKISQAQAKTQSATIKLEETQAKAAAAQKARDEQAAQRLAQQEAKQAAADARQIAAAEAKAAKLQAIADKQQRATRDFPTGQSSPNPVTQDDSPAVRYEPIITGNEDMSATAIKSTEAIAAENAALLEQQDVLGSLTTAQRANIETLLALQAERAVNATELKALNVEDAASGERAVFLTSEQIRLKIAISEVTVALNRQTKEALAADGAMTKLDQSVLLLRTAYEQLSVAERESEMGEAMKAELNALDQENKKLALSVGNTSKQIGDYEKGIGKASTATVLAEKVSAQFVRQLVRMAAQFLLITVAIGAVTWLYDYIKALDFFNPVATETEKRQKALNEAFDNADYKKAVTGIQELGVNLDLAKQGFADSDAVIDEYNNTIGKTAGYVNDLADAQKGFADNAALYIDMIQKETAANIILGESSGLIAENEKRRQELNEGIAESQKKLAQYKASGATNPTIEEREYQLTESIKENQQEIIDNDKRLAAQLSGSNAAAENLLKGKLSDQNKLGGGAGKSDTADRLDKLASDELEQEKIIAQAKINNEKLSYKTRLQAAEDFYNASKQQEEIHQGELLHELPENDARREGIMSESNNKLLQLQQAYHNQVEQLNDKAYKQDQQHLKNNLEAQRDLFKQIVDDPNQSYSMKLIALDQYNKKAQNLNDQTFNEAKTEAGKNGKALTLAKDEFAKADLERKKYIADESLKIQKEAFAKIQEQSQENQEEQLYTLDRGSKQALEALDKHKNDLINAKTAERDAGKIGEKQYTHDLLLINDAYNVQRIQQEIQTQAAILGIKEGTRDSTVIQMKQDGATPDDISKYTKTANRGIQATQDTLSGLQSQYGDATTKFASDKGKPVGKDKNDARNLEIFALEQTGKAVDELDKLRQKAYENEIARLEKIGEQIDENAANEKAQVDNSILSAKDKQNQINVIDAQAAAQKQQLQGEINQEKHKADVAEKEATIAKIIIEGALAVIKALAETGPFAPAIIGLTYATVAVELATAIATPLPKYAKGTNSYPGGFGIWGEAGMERATLPDGSVQFSNGAALANFPKGTIITPHKELMAAVGRANHTGGSEIGWREVVAALNRQKYPEQKRPYVKVNVYADRSGLRR